MACNFTDYWLKSFLLSELIKTYLVSSQSYLLFPYGQKWMQRQLPIELSGFTLLECPWLRLWLETKQILISFKRNVSISRQQEVLCFLRYSTKNLPTLVASLTPVIQLWKVFFRIWILVITGKDSVKYIFWFVKRYSILAF